MFKIRFYAFLIVAILILPAAAMAEAPFVSPHKIQSVVLYPNSAKVTVSVPITTNKLPSGETVIVGHLPGYASPATLSADIDGKITAINIKRLQEDDPSDPFREPWRQAVLNAQRECESLNAEKEATELRVEMWKNPGLPTANLGTELEKLDAAMQKGLKSANEALLSLAPKLKLAESNLNVAQQNLNQIAPSYEVTFVVSKVVPEGKLTFSYLLGNCGWQPVYTLNALPDSGKIEFGFSAKVNQISGFDWNDINLSLATNAPTWQIAPPYLNQWQIGALPNTETRMKENVMAAQAPMAMDMMRAETASEDVPSPAPEFKPQEVIFSTYSIWQMGKKNMLHNQESVYSVTDDTLDAKFVYTARPYFSTQAFLTAVLDEKSDKKILPPAQSIFMVDGNTVGDGTFPVADGEPIFFGPDPQINVVLNQITNQAGEKGFIGKSQVRKWEWKMEIENKRKTPAEIRIEDTMPYLPNEKVELVLQSKPIPNINREKGMYVWETSIEPGGKYSIDHNLEASAPNDVPMDSNR